MIADGISPDNVTYFTIIQGCMYQGMQDFALNLLLEAIHYQKSKRQNRQFKIAFTPQQSSQLCYLIKNLMLDENNKTAVKRYKDLNTILEFFDQGGKENLPVQRSFCNHNILTDVSNQPKLNPFAVNFKPTF